MRGRARHTHHTILALGAAARLRAIRRGRCCSRSAAPLRCRQTRVRRPIGVCATLVADPPRGVAGRLYAVGSGAAWGAVRSRGAFLGCCRSRTLQCPSVLAQGDCPSTVYWIYLQGSLL